MEALCSTSNEETGEELVEWFEDVRLKAFNMEALCSTSNEETGVVSVEGFVTVRLKCSSNHQVRLCAWMERIEHKHGRRPPQVRTHFDVPR
ncbi:unnamed protein product [Mesocestoides corti]|uniref:Uncharacterized protein n=1 Tax=Mesocestoides corti TaxID=53468 RepID=A0A0R3UPG7_MESCO|nr:unnamed protein product [Mesocestoides corti]